MKIGSLSSSPAWLQKIKSQERLFHPCAIIVYRISFAKKMQLVYCYLSTFLVFGLSNSKEVVTK